MFNLWDEAMANPWKFSASLGNDRWDVVFGSNQYRSKTLKACAQASLQHSFEDPLAMWLDLWENAYTAGKISDWYRCEKNMKLMELAEITIKDFNWASKLGVVVTEFDVKLDGRKTRHSKKYMLMNIGNKRMCAIAGVDPDIN